MISAFKSMVTSCLFFFSLWTLLESLFFACGLLQQLLGFEVRCPGHFFPCIRINHTAARSPPPPLIMLNNVKD